MNITQKQMDEINNIQLNIFKEFSSICKKLNLKYFAVHGTLLGAIIYNGFCPFDDDIDVAMPRKDYDKLIKEGSKIINDKYFIQSYNSEKEYPLVFSKIRDKETAFIQPILKKLNINQGIYIDIFPIDNYPNNKLIIFISRLKEKIYSSRLYNKMNLNKIPFIKRISLILSCILIPNYYKAIKSKSNIYSKCKISNKCIIYGGKKQERGINWNLFGHGKKIKFEDTEIMIPEKSEEYLSIIYGDYQNYSPMGKYMISETEVTISAEIYDVKNSYKMYLESKNEKH